VGAPAIPIQESRVLVMTKFMVRFSVAQAFTPGSETGGAIKAPLMGLLKLTLFSYPGVNAWAAEKLFKLTHYRVVHLS